MHYLAFSVLYVLHIDYNICVHFYCITILDTMNRMMYYKVLLLVLLGAVFPMSSMSSCKIYRA